MSKILSFILRLGITYVSMVLIFAFIKTVLNLSESVGGVFMSVVGIIGFVYSVNKFNTPLSFLSQISFLSQVDNSITKEVKNHKSKKIEDEMLRVRELYDKKILSEEEYQSKVDTLKKEYI